MTVRRIAALLALGLLVAACSTGPGTGGFLEGTDWVLRSYAVEGSLVTVSETQFADAEFRSNRVSGFSGCNDFDARYRAGGRTLFISEPASTLVACADEANALEAAYVANLQASPSTASDGAPSRSSMPGARRSSCSMRRLRTRCSATGRSTHSRPLQDR